MVLVFLYRFKKMMKPVVISLNVCYSLYKSNDLNERRENMKEKRFKCFKKFIPLCLMLCIMIFSAIPVQAASKITLESGGPAPNMVYTGKTYTLKVAGTTVKFYSSNKSVATI